MLGRSRVSSTLDTGRLGKALARPGMDTRIWVSYGIVKAVTIDSVEGVFADVEMMPTQRVVTARVGADYAGTDFGFYTPLLVDDEVLVASPSGDPDNGLVVIKRFHSPSDPLPDEVDANPEDVILVVRPEKTVRIITKGGGNVVLQAEGAGQVKLGDAGADQAVIRGDSYVSAEKTFVDAVLAFAGTCSTSPPAIPLATLTVASAVFKLAIDLAKSGKVKIP